LREVALIASCGFTGRTVDVVKVKVMADYKHEFKGSLHCAAQVFRNEGEQAWHGAATALDTAS